MPIYPYKCPKCEEQFEVSRSMRNASDPAYCPTDGAEATRIYLPPMFMGRSSGSERAPAPPGGPGLSHGGHGHSHGPGSHTH
jgi:putative FmdB family regulatory protein